MDRFFLQHETVFGIERTTDHVVFEDFDFKLFTFVSDVIYKSLSNALPLKTRIHEQTADFIAVQRNESDDATIRFPHPIFRDGQIHVGDVMADLLLKFVTQKRVSDLRRSRPCRHQFILIFRAIITKHICKLFLKWTCDPFLESAGFRS